MKIAIGMVAAIVNVPQGLPCNAFTTTSATAPSKMTMMLITTRSSISVNALIRKRGSRPATFPFFKFFLKKLQLIKKIFSLIIFAFILNASVAQIISTQFGNVQGTINGYGERCGNAYLCSVIPNLVLKMGYTCESGKKIQYLTEVSRFVSETANLAHVERAPFVGHNAFAHKGGVHVSAVMKTALTYEHIVPETVGNMRRVLISDLSGRSNVLFKVKELGVKLDEKSLAVQKIVDEIKEMEHYSYSYEDAEGSFELMVKRHTGEMKHFFDLERFKVSIQKDHLEKDARSEALIKIRVGNETEITAAEGDGPVNALDKALRKALEKFYPELSEIHLTDYKVRVLDTQNATAAKVRVLIETQNGESSWNTVGVSPDVVEASWKALVDSISYHLLKHRAGGSE